MDKVKILYISHSQWLYGAELSLLTLLKCLNRERFEPVVILPGDGPLTAEVKGLGIKTYLCPLDRWIRFGSDCFPAGGTTGDRAKHIADIIRDENIRLVHTNTSIIHEGALAARLAGVPHVWHIHETLPDHPELSSVLPLPLTLYAINHLSAVVVTVADMVKQQFIDVGAVEKLYTVYNGVETAPFYDSGVASIRDELGISKKEVLAVIVGGVTKRKGYPQMLEAARIVRNAKAPVKFLWVGPLKDNDKDSFQSMIEELGLEDTFYHMDFRRDIPRILLESDFLVLPSINEAFPLVILEAMAAGKAVVATCCGGTVESVCDEETGFLVPVADPEALAEKILTLAKDDVLRQTMGLKAVEKFKDKFSAEISAHNIESLYELILSFPPSQDTSSPESVLVDGVLKMYESLVTEMEESRKVKRELSESERLSNNLRNMVSEREHHILDLQRLLAERDRILAEQESLLADKNANIEVLNNRIDELINSLSWKVTKPIRLVGDMLVNRHNK